MNKDKDNINDKDNDAPKASPSEKSETESEKSETKDEAKAETKEEAKAEQAEAIEEEVKSLKEVIKERATEDELPQSRHFSLKKILGGDILDTAFMRRQVWLFLLIALFMVVYIANRYSCQKDIIEIDQLQKDLQESKYRALSSMSKITEKSRQSNVLEILKNNKDSTLKMPTQPPYIITVPE